MDRKDPKHKGERQNQPECDLRVPILATFKGPLATASLRWFATISPG